MEHVVQFAIGIDDKGIKEAATILADRLFRTKAAKELLENTNEVKEK